MNPKKYRINEIFYSLQGEGARAGSPNVFIRFADCNLSCGFCDTEFESGKWMSRGEIVADVIRLMNGPRAVILTGGEPLLQFDDELFFLLKRAARTIAVETNGTIKAKREFFDWITLSPKIAEHALVKIWGKDAEIDELKYVRRPGQSIPEPKLSADHYYLSPQADGNKIKKESLQACIDLCKANPAWKLSVQQHKLWGVR